MAYRKSIDVKGYAWASTLAGAFLCYCAFRLDDNSFWAQLALGLGTSSFSLAVGLWILNIYIQGDTQRGAIRAFLVWTYPMLRDRHNRVRDAFWPEFGRQQWEDIVAAFALAHFDGTTLSRQTIASMMRVLRREEREQRNACNDMVKFLIEMEFLFGWTFNNIVLEKIFLAKADFRRFKSCDFSKPPDYQDICRSYLAAEVHCTELTRQLFKILHVDIGCEDRLPLDIDDIIGAHT